MKLSKTEADLLLPIGETELTGDPVEVCELITNVYWVIDDSPFPYPVRARQMKILETLAAKLNFTIAM